MAILGQGGMGAIYRAVDENLGIDVAVKENLFTTEEYARQFRREAIILANLRHPNLPRVSDHFVIKGQGQYLVMDYIEGEDLRERMDRLGAIPENDVITIGTTICDALSYMHSQNPPVLHRDIKPGNVKITPEGAIYLVDFGLAKIALSKIETSTGARAMTPGYSPPEQYGGARTDQRSDVYSLGATLYAALTGFIPEDSLAQVMGQTKLTPIRRRNKKVSRKLASTIEKSLMVHPEDRYQTAGEFKKALLSARSITRRRRTSLNTIPPTPYKNNKAIRDIPDKPAEKNPPPAEDTQNLIPISESYKPINKPQKEQQKHNWGCLFLSSFIIFLIAIVSFWKLNRPVAKQTIETVPAILETAVINTATQQATLENTASAADNPGLTPSGTKAVVQKVSQTPLPTETSTVRAGAGVIVTATPKFTANPAQSNNPTATPIGGGYGQLAFASKRSGKPQIWLVNLDDKEMKQITDMKGGACQPDWSPDGSKLVFISPCQSNQEIYRGAGLFVINADGSELTPILGVGGGDYDPAWSPDGNSIVFTSLRNGARPQLYKYNLLDNQVTKLTKEKFVRDFQPSWSPDGKQIVFISTRRGPYQIWIMDKNGNNQLRFSVSKDKKNTHPVWSPDGQIILYTQTKSKSSIPRLTGVRVSEQGVGEFPVYGLPEVIPMRNADYSPDGIWIAFEAWPEGSNHDIYIMLPNGAELTRITTDPSWDFDPAWRPTPSN